MSRTFSGTLSIHAYNACGVTRAYSHARTCRAIRRKPQTLPFGTNACLMFVYRQEFYIPQRCHPSRIQPARARQSALPAMSPHRPPWWRHAFVIQNEASAAATTQRVLRTWTRRHSCACPLHLASERGLPHWRCVHVPISRSDFSSASSSAARVRQLRHRSATEPLPSRLCLHLKLSTLLFLRPGLGSQELDLLLPGFRHLFCRHDALAAASGTISTTTHIRLGFPRELPAVPGNAMGDHWSRATHLMASIFSCFAASASRSAAT